jgi:hypothetical protein
VYGWSSGSILSATTLLTRIAYHKPTRLGRVERSVVLTVSLGRWAAYDNCLLSAEVVVMTEMNRPSTVILLNTSALNTEECLSYPPDCPHSPLHPVTEERFIKVSVLTGRRNLWDNQKSEDRGSNEWMWWPCTRMSGRCCHVEIDSTHQLYQTSSKTWKSVVFFTLQSVVPWQPSNMVRAKSSSPSPRICAIIVAAAIQEVSAAEVRS